jgi:hypothetical protein
VAADPRKFSSLGKVAFLKQLPRCQTLGFSQASAENLRRKFFGCGAMVT